MKYEEIYSRSYMKKYDPKFYENKDFAYETMKEWMHEIVALPYVRNAFSTITFDDEIEEFTFTLVNSVDEDSDNEFVKKLFSDGFVICWMRPQVDSVVNLARVIVGKDEKTILNNYKPNIERLDSLERKHKKYVRDYGYHNGLGGTE